MRWTHLLAIPFVAVGPAAQEEKPSTPVITVAGQSFATWQEYTSSQLFRTLGLRCGTQSDGSTTELRPASDCSGSSTTIRPEYQPGAGPHYRIPVVVHIIMSSTGAGQISDALVHSQIDVLNEDFLALAGTLGENGTDAQIEFFLATEDPNGNPTTGITRTINNTWFNDDGAYYSTLNWDAHRYLNFYTNSASGALGYVPALPQGGIVGADFDRVVVLWSAFGRNAPIGPPYDLGRTATHELGHYFGLNHTFNGGCGSASACYTTGDLICDTNREAGPVFGCPASSSSCSGGLQDPFHNYMDYSDDDCYEEFTPEQVNRMRCTLANWRVDLHQPLPSCTTPASNAWRNGGINLDVYTATPAVLGANITFAVTDPTHNFAVISGFAAPRHVVLPSGQVSLVNPASGLVFRLVVGTGGVGVNLLMPNDIALCGLTAYSQAILKGINPAMRTNAIDLTAGI